MMLCGRDYKLCKHKCSKRCHGEDGCIEIECDIQIKIFCKCKVFSRSIKCGEYKKLYEDSYILPCVEECAKQLRLKKIENMFDDLFKYNEEKNKIFTKKILNTDDTSNNHSLDDHFSNKYIDTKFENNLLNFAKKNLRLILELEVLVEKALKNIGQKFELPKIEKKLFIHCIELLKNYYNIKVDKIKKAGEHWSILVISDCSQAVLPKYKLSLMALLFRQHKFANNLKLNIYHPFEMSILIQNYRYSVSFEDIESYILSLISINKNSFYVDEIEKGRCYVHFFDCDLGKKIYNQLKLKPSQYQEAYDIYYNRKENLKLDELYLYLKNSDYFDLLYDEPHESETTKKESDIKKENDQDGISNIDEDGFVIINKKRKTAK